MKYVIAIIVLICISGCSMKHIACNIFLNCVPVRTSWSVSEGQLSSPRLEQDFSGRPSIDRLGRDALRFEAAPQLSGMRYLVEIHTSPMEHHAVGGELAEGVFVAETIDPTSLHLIHAESYPLSMQVEEYRDVVRRIDHQFQVAGKPQASVCQDGTVFELSRVRESSAPYIYRGNLCEVGDPGVVVCGFRRCRHVIPRSCRQGIPI